MQVLLWKMWPAVQPGVLLGIPDRSYGGLLGPDVQLPLQHGQIHLQYVHALMRIVSDTPNDMSCNQSFDIDLFLNLKSFFC